MKQVWLADDASAAGSIASPRGWYELLIEEGKKAGYYVNQSKIILNYAAENIFGESVNITAEGKRHI